MCACVNVVYRDNSSDLRSMLRGHVVYGDNSRNLRFLLRGHVVYGEHSNNLRSMLWKYVVYRDTIAQSQSQMFVNSVRYLFNSVRCLSTMSDV